MWHKRTEQTDFYFKHLCKFFYFIFLEIYFLYKSTQNIRYFKTFIQVVIFLVQTNFYQNILQ